MNNNKKSPWNQSQFDNWYQQRPVLPSRDYKKTIEPRIVSLNEQTDYRVEKYGDVDYKTNDLNNTQLRTTHNLYRILIGDFTQDKPCYIVIGGTHGYEKSGPLACLKFAEEDAKKLKTKFNIVVYPCLSPGPYEKELRFSEGRIDINRDAFLEGAKTQEMQAFSASLKELHSRVFKDDLSQKFTAAIDLHETPFMDIAIDKESAQAGGELFELDIFPRGMFLIAFDEDQALGNKIIQQVRAEGHHVVDDNTLYGSPNHDGILLMSEMGAVTGRVRQLVKHYTTASFTTEYCDEKLTDNTPDNERVDPQMAAIRGMFL